MKAKPGELISNLQPFIKENWKRLLGSLALLAVLFGNQGFRSLVRNWIELKHLRGEIASLQKEETRQSDNLHAFRADDLSVERMARKELGYIKKGEIEYRFNPPPPEK